MKNNSTGIKSLLDAFVIPSLVVVLLWFGIGLFSLHVPPVAQPDLNELSRAELLDLVASHRHLERQALSGDKFGGVNALFTGLALAFLAATLYVQLKEFRSQREALHLQREEMTKSTEEQARAANHSALAAAISAETSIMDHYRHELNYTENKIYILSDKIHKVEDNPGVLREYYKTMEEHSLCIERRDDLQEIIGQRAEHIEKYERSIRTLCERIDLDSLASTTVQDESSRE